MGANSIRMESKQSLLRKTKQKGFKGKRVLVVKKTIYWVDGIDIGALDAIDGRDGGDI